MLRRSLLPFFLLICTLVHAQDTNMVEMGETLKEYIQENHVEQIEKMVHEFTSSDEFISFLKNKGHNIPAGTEFGKKDVVVGEDLDVYVKHITEHQNFTMIMVPVSIYKLAVYDTLLFSVLEVSETYVQEKYYQRDLDNPEERARILSKENHDMLTHHMYSQAMRTTIRDISEIQVDLHESYISTSKISVHVKDLSPEEKKSLRHSWGVMKKAFAHNIDMNVEMNVYIFGANDMTVVYLVKDKRVVYKITPQNIFTRHHFTDQN